jgi:hypothetical protein
MKLTSQCLLSFALSTSLFATPQSQGAEPQISALPPEDVYSRVEKVFRVEIDGYLSVVYQVTYQGHEIIVHDVLSKSDYAVGDKIHFLVMKHDMSSASNSKAMKLLNFTIL